MLDYIQQKKYILFLTKEQKIYILRDIKFVSNK